MFVLFCVLLEWSSGSYIIKVTTTIILNPQVEDYVCIVNVLDEYFS